MHTKIDNPQTMSQPRSITLTFTKPDPASFIQGVTAAFLLTGLHKLSSSACTTSILPAASTIRGLLFAAAMPCGIYAFVMAMVESDAINREEEKEGEARLGGTRVADDAPRDGSLLTVRSEMRLEANLRVARRACVGVGLFFGGSALLFFNVINAVQAKT